MGYSYVSVCFVSEAAILHDVKELNTTFHNVYNEAITIDAESHEPTVSPLQHTERQSDSVQQ